MEFLKDNDPSCFSHDILHDFITEIWEAQSNGENFLIPFTFRKLLIKQV